MIYQVVMASLKSHKDIPAQHSMPYQRLIVQRCTAGLRRSNAPLRNTLRADQRLCGAVAASETPGATRIHTSTSSWFLMGNFYSKKDLRLKLPSGAEMFRRAWSDTEGIHGLRALAACTHSISVAGLGWVRVASVLLMR